MKLGILTAPFADTPLTDVADWAASRRLRGAGDRLLAEGRPARRRRYAGTSHIDVARTSASQGEEIVAALADKGLAISALGYYPNPLHPDAGAPRGGHRASEDR